MKSAKRSKTSKQRVGGTRRAASRETIAITLTGLAAKTRRIRVPFGTRLEDLPSLNPRRGLEIRVNKRKVPLSTKLRRGDVVVVVPDSITGGIGRHFESADLRSRMSSKDYDFFVKFVGADSLGFRQEDLEF